MSSVRRARAQNRLPTHYMMDVLDFLDPTIVTVPGVMRPPYDLQKVDAEIRRLQGVAAHLRRIRAANLRRGCAAQN